VYWTQTDVVRVLQHPLVLASIMMGVLLGMWVDLQYSTPHPIAGWLMIAVVNTTFVAIGGLLLVADYYWYFQADHAFTAIVLYFAASVLWLAASSCYVTIALWFRLHIYHRRTRSGDGQLGFWWITWMGVAISLFHLMAFTFGGTITVTSRLLELLAHLLLATNLGVYILFGVIQGHRKSHFQYWHGGIVAWVVMTTIRVAGVLVKLSVLGERFWFVYEWNGQLPSRSHLEALDQSWQQRVLTAHSILLASDWVLAGHSWWTWRVHARSPIVLRK
jgi:hypothetical protein